jgi:hypothetical protein
MDNTKNPKNLSRRDLLKLAGTAAAFCASFGFLHGEVGAGQELSQVAGKETLQALKMKWAQAQFKFYSGGRLLHASELPPAVLNVLQTNVKGVIQVKLYQGGALYQTMGKIRAVR